MKFNSKTREGAKSFSRQASAVEISQDNLPLAQIGGTQKVGSVTVDQLGMGVEFPTVQSAIDDIVNLYQTPINGVVTYASDTVTPQGVNMTERLLFSGVPLNGVIEVYGLQVPIKSTDSISVIVDNVYKLLTSYKDKGVAFKDIVKTVGVSNQLDVTFIDTNKHNNYVYQGSGLTVTGTTSTNAVAGYGTWTNIGTSNITDSTGASTTLHYYKRIS